MTAGVQVALLPHPQGQIGLITLDRPQALNALSAAMIQEVTEALLAWQHDSRVLWVVVTSNPGRAFCAGGDIKSLYEMKQQGQSHGAMCDYFYHEYRMNHLLYAYPKPVISLIDGLTFGGGVGIALHNRIKIAGDNFIAAMPETQIGLIPDVGASFLLSKLPGSMGLYLGLTGTAINVADAYDMTLIDSHVPIDKWPALWQLWHNLADINEETLLACAQSLAEPLPDKSLAPQSMIDEVFAGDDIGTIIEQLSCMENAWAKAALEKMRYASPASLCLTQALLIKAKGLSMTECLQREYTVVSHLLQQQDFFEGVRAMVIDKDKTPKWSHSLKTIKQAWLDQYFVLTAKPLEFLL